MQPNPETLKVKKQLSRREILFSIARRPESEMVFAGASTGELVQVDLSAEKPEAKTIRGHDSYVSSLLWAGDSLISSGYDGRLIWRDPETAAPVRSINGHARWIRMAVASPDASKVISVADDMVARIWDAATGSLVRELKGHGERTPNHFPSMLYAVACTPDGKHVATADKPGFIYIWEIETGKRVAEMRAPLMYTWDPKARIHSIGGISQIGNIDHLGALARIEIFDWQKQERLHEFPGDTHKGLVERMQFSPDGKWLLAAGGDHGGFIKTINLETGKIIKQDKAPAHVHDFVVNESFDRIYAAAHGKFVVWEMT